MLCLYRNDVTAEVQQIVKQAQTSLSVRAVLALRQDQWRVYILWW